MLFEDLINGTVEETVDFRGRDITVVFTPDRVSEKDIKEFQEMDAQTEAKKKVCEVLAKGVQSWSIETKPGADDFPPTAKNLMRDDFPPALLTLITDRLVSLIVSPQGKAQSPSK